MDRDKTLGVALVKECCPLCGAVMDGPIIINTRLTTGMAKKVEDLNGKIIGYAEEPCTNCKAYMSQGFLIIGVVEAKTTKKTDPYRSGNIWVISQEAAKNLVNDQVLLDQGAAFMDVNVAKKIGLPGANLNA